MTTRLISVTCALLFAVGSLVAQNFWQEINVGLIEPYIRAIVAGDSGYVFTGTPEGVFRSTNNGDTWQLMANTSGVTVQSLHYNGGRLYGGTANGLYLSTDNGVNWSILSGVPDTLILCIATKSGGFILAGTDGLGLYGSTDYGSNWMQLNGGLTSVDITTLAITPLGTIYAGTDDQGMFRSEDDGITWTQYNNGMTEPLIRALAVNAGGDVFAGGNTEGIFRLAAGDTMWVPIDSGLTTRFINALGVQSNGTVYAGTFGGGVFRSTNNGAYWEELNTGLLNLDVFAIAFDADGYVYAGTAGGGDFRSVQPKTTIEDVESPRAFMLEQNYPNPFNPATIIRYQLPSSGMVTLKVFDILGQEVATLVDEVQDPGLKIVEWNRTDAPSGVYFYRIIVGTYVEVKKMMIMK